MKSKRIFLDHLDAWVPPGTDPWVGVRVFFIGLTVCAALCFATFGAIHDALYSLYDYESGGLVLSARMMPPFLSLCGVFPYPVGIMSALCLLGGIGQYRAFSRDSHALYLMRRLPTRGELFRRVALLPLLGWAAAMVVFAVLFGVFFLVYLRVTPEGHLPLQL